MTNISVAQAAKVEQPPTVNLKTQSVRRVLVEYWRQIKTIQAWGWACFMAYLVSNLLASLAGPYALKLLIDTLAGDPSQIWSQTELWFWVFAALTVGIMLCHRLGDFFIVHFQLLGLRKLDAYVFSCLRQHSHGFFNNQFVGSLVNKSKRFVHGFETLHDLLTYNAVPAAVALISTVVLMFLELPSMALWLLLWIAIYLGVTWKLSRYKMRYDLKAAKASSASTAHLADVMTNIPTLKSFSAGELEQGRYWDTATRLLKAREKSWWFNFWMMVFQGIATTSLKILGLGVAVWSWSRGETTAGTVVLIVWILNNLGDHLWSLGRLMTNFTQAVSDAEEMVEIIHLPVEVQDPEVPEPSRMQHGELVLDRVSFAYPNGESLYKHLNLTIPAGQRVGIVGPSGGGKSTLFKLIMRNMEVTSGRILVDGQNIRAVTQDDLRSAMSYVPQDPDLFHRSLYDNIAYADPETDASDIETAAERADAHRFIDRLAEGYDTLVGERGVKLSGGERQRVAIARAMLKQAPILLLDEATSALDSLSEGQIQQQLETLMQCRTTLVIAHRISTIRAMDRILVVQQGQIIEDGSHEQLLKLRGVYADLWSRQSSGFIQE